ncbi:MAG: ribosome biogenesis GTPase Der [Brevinematales bacterium]|jgi:GTP-binding protein
MKNKIPIVAIIGRPNVGKSSLFNLLLGERKSIVDEMEGVTRDINMGVVRTGRMTFKLLDTAGYLEKGDDFNKLVQEKIREALTGTDLVLFIVDGREPHPYDEDIARILKREQKPVIIIANKLDNREMEILASQFYSLGFDTIIPFSVSHKRGYVQIIEIIEDMLSHLEYSGSDQGPEAGEIKIAIVGKPNVGKSMLINRLLGYERSIVSDIPGTTRDALDDVFEYSGQSIRLIDTAGLRRKSKVSGNIEYFSNVRTVQTIERSDVVIMLMDAAEQITQQDRKIVEMVIEKGKALVIAYNKWDLKRTRSDDDYKQMEATRKHTYREIGIYQFVPVEFISAQDGYHIDRLMELVFRVDKDYHFRVSTGVLNAWVSKEFRESDLNKPSSNLRIYYATQIYSAPPKFMFFINKKEHVRKDFPRQIEKKLREAFEFTGTPIKITFKEKS